MIKRPSLGQWFLKLGLPLNDPIVELGATWAAGVGVGSASIERAILSAEYLTAAKDKRLRGAGRAITNKLIPLLAEARRWEGMRQFRHKAGSLSTAGRYENPKRRRKNPWREDLMPRTKAALTRLKKRLRKASPSTRRALILALANPKRRRTARRR